MITYYFVYNSLDIDINQIHLNWYNSCIYLLQVLIEFDWHMSAYECNWMCMKSHSSSWYDLQAVVGDIATTSLAANDSQNSNDLLVLHSFQEECWQTKVDLQYLAQKIFDRDLQLSGFLNLPLFYSLLFLHKYITLTTILISVISFRNDNCNKMQTRQISNQWKWFGWVASRCSGCSWNEKISSSVSLSHLLYFQYTSIKIR